MIIPSVASKDVGPCMTKPLVSSSMISYPVSRIMAIILAQDKEPVFPGIICFRGAGLLLLPLPLGVSSCSLHRGNDCPHVKAARKFKGHHHLGLDALCSTDSWTTPPSPGPALGCSETSARKEGLPTVCAGTESHIETAVTYLKE